MGERGNLHVYENSPKVVPVGSNPEIEYILFTHWRGHEIPEMVQKAIRSMKGSRDTQKFLSFLAKQNPGVFELFERPILPDAPSLYVYPELREVYLDTRDWFDFHKWTFGEFQKLPPKVMEMMGYFDTFTFSEVLPDASMIEKEIKEWTETHERRGKLPSEEYAVFERVDD